MSGNFATRLAASAEARAAVAFVDQTSAIAAAEIRKLARDPVQLATRAVQPALWLLVFGQVFARIKGIATGDMSYLEFMTPGVLAQSILFTAIFYGIAVIWERDLGIVHKILVSPANRTALVLGKALAAGVRGLSQAVIIYALALLLRVHLRLDVPSVAGVVCTVMLGSATFSTLSLLAACVVKTRERFMGIGQVITLPLFFASSAIYPVAIMPGWLQRVSNVNPLSYMVDGLRALMLPGVQARVGFDIAVLATAALVISVLSAWLYPKVVM